MASPPTNPPPCVPIRSRPYPSTRTRACPPRTEPFGRDCRLCHARLKLLAHMSSLPPTCARTRARARIGRLWLQVDGQFLVYRIEDNKVLKSVEYSPADLAGILDLENVPEATNLNR